MALTRSSLSQLTDPTAFLWSAGIEDTFITDPWPETGRILDEYELTGHYQYWKQDINLLKDLGVKVVRYGTPWHRISPASGKWDWNWTDRSLDYLLESGIDPIVDLVHYGVPAWIEGAFLNPDFPQHMAEYASRLAGRFKGRIQAYTPLNEPRITAWYCGKLGWWPPYRKGWKGFVQVMLGLCRGIVLTVEALQAVDSEIVPVHVDATDLYETAEAALETEVQRRQEIVFLALDLISGRIRPQHPLYDWLVKLGVEKENLAWFEEHAVDLSLIGINLYPMYSRKILFSSPQGVKIRMPYSSTGIIERLSELYWQRYQSPLFISETASVGSVKRRRAWLDSSVEAVRQTRSKGIPLIGYTWWPMLGIVTWAYRQGSHPASYYIKQMGLWDLDPEPSANLRRIHTSLVNAYQELAAGGCDKVGALALEREGV